MSKPEEEAAPPSYNEAQAYPASAQPVHPQQPAFAQQPVFSPQPGVQPVPQTVYVQPVMVNQVAVHSLKDAKCFESYLEFCPYCNATVQTDVRYTAGSCFWIYCCISMIICWPLIFCLCCDQSKDAHHFCPCCRREIAVKIR